MRFSLRNPFSGRRPHTADTHLDSVMADDNPPAAVEPLLRAIAAEARPHELDGLPEALGLFTAAFPMSSTPARTTWRKRMLSPLGAAIAGLALALGGTAAAAYTGSLPADAQDFAHTAIGAPAARPTATKTPTSTATPSERPTESESAKPTAKGTPVGPDASGPAAKGLCTAWTAHQRNGGSVSSEDSVAFTNLATAAGGADKIAAYCATVLGADSSSHPTGKPTTVPTQAQSHPGGKPDALPTQANTDHPTGKPTKS